MKPGRLETAYALEGWVLFLPWLLLHASNATPSAFNVFFVKGEAGWEAWQGHSIAASPSYSRKFSF